MRDWFDEALTEALKYASDSKNDRKLGTTPFAHSRLVLNRLRETGDIRSFPERGKTLRKVIDELIETHKDDLPILHGLHFDGYESNEQARRQLIDAEKIRPMERSQFFKEVTAEKVMLADELLHCLQTPVVEDNLPRPPYDEFIDCELNGDSTLMRKLLHSLTGRAFVTAIVGIGGLGKTAAAYELALRAAKIGMFDHVVWTSVQQNRLGPDIIHDVKGYLTSIDDILDTIGAELGSTAVADLSTDDKMKKVCEILIERRILLVIDGLEFLDPSHVESLYSFLEEYFPEPSVAVITSRDNSYIGGAKTVPLPGMPEESAKQFIAMTCRSLGFSELADQHVTAILERCAGIPLAMKFIIGQVHHSGSSILDALDEVSADEPFFSDSQNHHLLEYLAQNSFSLLEDDDKSVLRAMELFAAPARKESVIAATKLQLSEVSISLDKLESLFFLKCLRSEKQGPVQYELPLPTRMLIRELLPRDVGNAIMSLGRLADHFAEEAQDHGRLMNYENLNVMTVLEGCYSTSQWEAVVKLFKASGFWMGVHGLRTKRIEMGKKAIKAAKSTHDQQSEAWIMVYDVAWSYIELGDWENAEEWLKEGLNLAQRLGDRKIEAVAIRNLAIVARDFEEDLQKAETLYSDALAIFDELGEESWIAMSKGGLAVVEIKSSPPDLERAEGLLLDAKTLNVKLNNQPARTSNLSDLGRVATMRKRYVEATSLLNEALTKSQDLGLLPEEAYSNLHLAWLGVAQAEDGIRETPNSGSARSLRLVDLMKDIGTSISCAGEAKRIYDDIGAVRHPIMGEVDDVVDRLESLQATLAAESDSG